MPEDIRFYLISLVNNFRRENGKPPLSFDEALCAFAKAHTEHMANTGRLEHAPKHFRSGVGENINYIEGEEHPYQLAKAMFDDWVRSKTHKDIMLNAKHAAGIDVAHRGIGGNRKKLFMTGRFK